MIFDPSTPPVALLAFLYPMRGLRGLNSAKELGNKNENLKLSLLKPQN